MMKPAPGQALAAVQQTCAHKMGSQVRHPVEHRHHPRERATPHPVCCFILLSGSSSVQGPPACPAGLMTLHPCCMETTYATPWTRCNLAARTCPNHLNCKTAQDACKAAPGPHVAGGHAVPQQLQMQTSRQAVTALPSMLRRTATRLHQLLGMCAGPHCYGA